MVSIRSVQEKWCDAVVIEKTKEMRCLPPDRIAHIVIVTAENGIYGVETTAARYADTGIGGTFRLHLFMTKHGAWTESRSVAQMSYEEAAA
ncbi:MAG TPA: hypothetical protein VNG29_02565 [Candidatus Paceibacterota bacterium]|nr:hypothetical protein [Candidatus Paceibacterota bacterium]